MYKFCSLHSDRLTPNRPPYPIPGPMEIRRGGKRQHVEEAAEVEPASNAACNYCQ